MKSTKRKTFKYKKILFFLSLVVMFSVFAYSFVKNEKEPEMANETTLPLSSDVRPIANEDTSSWKTYEDREYNLRLITPQNWYVNEVGPTSIYAPYQRTFVISAPIENKSSQDIAKDQDLGMTISRYEHNGQSLDEWAVEWMTQPYGPGPGKIYLINVGKEKGLQLLYLDETSSINAVLVDNYRYVFIAKVNIEKNYEQYEALINQFLENVQFLD